MPTVGKTQTYGFLDQLSTEQLLDLVRADFESPEDGDDELIIHVLEVIEQREKENSPETASHVDQAWEDFQKYFHTPDGVGRSLYPMKDSSPKTVHTGRPRRRGRLLVRVAVVAAMIMSLSGMMMVQAMGFNVFSALARWTEETFYFITGTEEAGSENSEALQQAVQEAFDRCGVTIPAPSWYPKGTELVGDIDVVEEAEGSAVFCDFMYEGKIFTIEVQQYVKNNRVPDHTFEKNVADADEYYSNGRLFYIMTNVSDSCAAHSDGQTVMDIKGELSLRRLKQIIESIGA